ncbi:splicing factor-like protein 1, partial [Dioscorea cayenensis subsp. rotundata]|uniref:Branchpoint-bridging protein n=1 Tax=Dioscorea cayennensis subsp. rotundata TaxID=55577 RepID=A0AB40AV05_DIOCR
MGAAEVKGSALSTSGWVPSQGTRFRTRTKQCRFFLAITEGDNRQLCTSVPVFVNTLYNLVTDVYKWGYGAKASTFSFSIPNLSPATLVYKKLYIPIEENPEYKLLGFIIDPRENTQRRMDKKMDVRILIRSKGSAKDERLRKCREDSLGAFVKMVESLLVPVEDEANEYKHSRLLELAKLRQR